MASAIGGGRMPFIAASSMSSFPTFPFAMALGISITSFAACNPIGPLVAPRIVACSCLLCMLCEYCQLVMRHGGHWSVITISRPHARSDYGSRSNCRKAYLNGALYLT